MFKKFGSLCVLSIALIVATNFAHSQEVKNISYDTIGCQETTSEIIDDTSAANACTEAVKEAYSLCEMNKGIPVLGPGIPEISIDKSEENKFVICCKWGAGCVFKN